MFAILGSGFGLYGYLPAIIQGCNENVLLPERYRDRVQARSDIQSFANVINWRTDEDAALKDANSVIIAKDPAQQIYWLNKCLQYDNIEKIILEKPLAPTLTKATELNKQIQNSGKRFRIDYSFRFTDWGKNLLELFQQKRLNEENTLTIDWKFLAHHYLHNLNNWKRYSSAGGGAIKFYGIHIVALLAELGYSEVLSSEITNETTDEIETWKAIFIGKQLPQCHVFIDTKSGSEAFSINTNSDSLSRSLFLANDPFTTNKPSPYPDRRISILVQLCQDLLNNPDLSYSWYNQTIELWQKTEAITEIISQPLSKQLN